MTLKTSELSEPQLSTVKLWRWIFIGKGPSICAAIRVGEALRGAATSFLSRDGDGLLPESVYRDQESQHGHAFWLPGDEDRDGLIDHAWVYCSNGLPAAVISALAQIETLRIDGRSFRIAPEWMGPLIASGPFGPAKEWQGVTPYVTPKWRLTKTGKERAGLYPEDQILTELKQRGLPEPRAITRQPSSWVGDELLLASSFEMLRSKPGSGHAPPNDALASFPSITFREPVLGPLSLGYGAHFGLGQLMPVG